MKHSTKQSERKRLDPEKTRETILRAAFETFAARGYDGAAISDIALAAGVPKSLIQYHFGSKEELWSACLIGHVGPMIAAVDRFLADESADPSELIAARFRFLKANPEIRRLLVWSGMSSFPTPDFIEQRRARVLAKFGWEPTSPEFTRFLSALAATDGWFLCRNFYKIPLGDAIDDEAVEERLLQHLMDTVKRQ